MKKLVLCSLAAALLTLAPAALHAQSIGVNFASSDSPTTTTLAATDLAGVPAFAQTNWQNVTTVPTNLSLTDSAGSPTTARLTASGSTTFFEPAAAGPDERLNNGVLANFGTTLTLTLANIPYATYSLLVYDLSDGTGNVQSVTNGAVSFFTRGPDRSGAGYIDNNANTAFTYTQGLGLTAATATANADYVLFPGLTGASQTFTVLNTAGGFNFTTTSGFQIINTGVVPEPSTWALLGAGAGLLGVVTLRRRHAVRLRV